MVAVDDWLTFERGFRERDVPIARKRKIMARSIAKIFVKLLVFVRSKGRFELIMRDLTCFIYHVQKGWRVALRAFNA